MCDVSHLLFEDFPLLFETVLQLEQLLLEDIGFSQNSVSALCLLLYRGLILLYHLVIERKRWKSELVLLF